MALFTRESLHIAFLAAFVILVAPIGHADIPCFSTPSRMFIQVGEERLTCNALRPYRQWLAETAAFSGMTEEQMRRLKITFYEGPHYETSYRMLHGERPFFRLGDLGVAVLLDENGRLDQRYAAGLRSVFEHELGHWFFTFRIRQLTFSSRDRAFIRSMPELSYRGTIGSFITINQHYEELFADVFVFAKTGNPNVMTSEQENLLLHPLAQSERDRFTRQVQCRSFLAQRHRRDALFDIEHCYFSSARERIGRLYANRVIHPKSASVAWTNQRFLHEVGTVLLNEGHRYMSYWIQQEPTHVPLVWQPPQEQHWRDSLDVALERLF